ncbi:MAG TPA: GNAT family N-acetyltransferase [Opitutaceae bacterium]
MKEPSRSEQLLFRPARPEDGPAIRELVFSILKERRLPTDAHTDADLDDIYGHYFAAGGDFRVLTTEAGEIVGSIGLKPVDKRTIELRKMYLRATHRGQQHGKRMLAWAITRSRELGFKRITLETATVLKEAIALYSSHGFRPYDGEKCSSRCDQTYELEL